ncbi:hypothetical protein PINS_up024221 [Pythium insidiosum]|nr:hypothetical protein PINS_up024221 [Pythium insidiosum]
MATWCLQEQGPSQLLKSEFCADIDNQEFMYDSLNKLIRSVRDPTLCVHDGRSESSSSIFRLVPCNAADTNQQFTYDAASMSVRNPTKPGLCMEINAFTSTYEQCVSFVECSAVNPLEIVPVDMPLWKAGSSFMLRSATNPTLCADSGGGLKDGQWFLSLNYCDPANRNQLFTNRNRRFRLWDACSTVDFHEQ